MCSGSQVHGFGLILVNSAEITRKPPGQTKLSYSVRCIREHTALTVVVAQNREVREGICKVVGGVGI